jgi:hypothetical protein
MIWVLQLCRRTQRKEPNYVFAVNSLIKTNNINIECDLYMYEHGMRHVSTFYRTI